MQYQPIMTGYAVTLTYNGTVVLIDTWNLLQAIAVYSNAMQDMKAGEIVTLFKTEPMQSPIVVAKAYHCGKLSA
jgi:hypothetical protein